MEEFRWLLTHVTNFPYESWMGRLMDGLLTAINKHTEQKVFKKNKSGLSLERIGLNIPQKV